MEPQRQPAQLVQYPCELVLAARHPVPRLLTGRGLPAPAQGLRQFLEPPLSSVVQSALEQLARMIARVEQPSARCRELGDLGPHLRVEPRIGGLELGRGRGRV